MIGETVNKSVETEKFSAKKAIGYGSYRAAGIATGN